MRTTKMMWIAVAVVAGMTASFAPGARAAIMTLDVVADVHIRTSTPNTNQNNTGSQLLVGNMTGSNAMNTLLRFDTSVLAAMAGPGQWIQVDSVTLKVQNTGQSGSGGPVPIDVLLYGYTFGETTATWNNPAGDGSDTTLGGDKTGSLVADVSASVTANASVVFTSMAAFSTAVENATKGNNEINLILSRNPQTNANSYSRFRDRENFTTGYFQMDVNYTVIPEPATAGVLVLDAAAFLIRRRRMQMIRA